MWLVLEDRSSFGGPGPGLLEELKVVAIHPSVDGAGASGGGLERVGTTSSRGGIEGREGEVVEEGGHAVVVLPLMVIPEEGEDGGLKTSCCCCKGRGRRAAPCYCCCCCWWWWWCFPS